MSRRIILLISAIVLAGLGTAMIYAYVQSADDRAVEAQAPVSVLVAATPITAGTRVQDAADAGAFESQKLPAGSVAPGAVSSLEGLAEATAIAPIFPGQQILNAMFSTTATASAVSTLPLPPGMIAVSVQFGDPQRVAGFVIPGSEVAVFLSGQVGEAPAAARVLLPRVTVIAAGPTTVTPPADPTTANVEPLPKALLTLALDQADAEKLIFASDKGTLYLGLLNDASEVVPSNGTSAANLFA